MLYPLTCICTHKHTHMYARTHVWITVILLHLTKMYNDSNLNMNFPNLLKLEDITTTHKKDDTTKKGNYRPVSILPCASKIYERNMFDQISVYIEKYFSPYLCDFRKGYSTQYNLIVMIEKWRKALDNGKLAGALFSDLLIASTTI